MGGKGRGDGVNEDLEMKSTSWERLLCSELPAIVLPLTGRERI